MKINTSTAAVRRDFRCPWCGAPAGIAAEAASSQPLVFHALPMCAAFEQCSAEGFVAAAGLPADVLHPSRRGP